MRRTGALAGLIVLGAAATLSGFRQGAPPATAAPSRAPGRPGYAGSELCIGCHPTEHQEWKGSLHARTVHEPSESEKQLLSRSLLCGDEEAGLILGERHAKRFMTTSSAQPGKHVLLPCRYDVGPAEWVALHESDWRTITWERACGACHSVGFSSDDFSLREMGVGCEACHGADDRHGDHTSRGRMIDFATSSAKNEVTVCASCHLQGGRSRTTGLNYPRDYEAGEDLFADYQFDWKTLEKTGETTDNPIDIHQKLLIRDVALHDRADLRCSSCHEFHRMGHAKHEKLAKQDFCYLCHARADFKVKDYNQSCNVCEF